MFIEPPYVRPLSIQAEKIKVRAAKSLQTTQAKAVKREMKIKCPVVLQPEPYVPPSRHLIEDARMAREDADNW